MYHFYPTHFQLTMLLNLLIVCPGLLGLLMFQLSVHTFFFNNFYSSFLKYPSDHRRIQQAVIVLLHDCVALVLTCAKLAELSVRNEIRALGTFLKTGQQFGPLPLPFMGAFSMALCWCRMPLASVRAIASLPTAVLSGGQFSPPALLSSISFLQGQCFWQRQRMRGLYFILQNVQTV